MAVFYRHRLRVMTSTICSFFQFFITTNTVLKIRSDVAMYSSLKKVSSHEKYKQGMMRPCNGLIGRKLLTLQNSKFLLQTLRHELHEFEQGSNCFQFSWRQADNFTSGHTFLFKEISLVTEHGNIANVHFKIIR